MNSAALAVMVAGLLPIVCAGIAKWGARDYDNRDPRAWLARQDGRRARANAAQSNSLEAFAFFAAAVVLALQAANDATQVAQVAQWAWLFVALRVLYIVCYVADRATLRSIVWLLGVAVVIRLYAMAL
jgi:uncharacterized MAPEG superfamily protein